MNNIEISKIFKDEYSNLVAVLCHYYALDDIQLAQDIVADTFIKAMKTWSHKGIPESPVAWLRTAAKHILIDKKRRTKNYKEKIVPHLKLTSEKSIHNEITEEIIEDSQLRMIFQVCDPDLNHEAQICLALRILCGFSIEEISTALLSNKETVNKKLYRAKNVIRDKNKLESNLDHKDYLIRLDKVLRVIYLLFNEGYNCSVNEQNIRREICWEAMHLCKILDNQNQFPKSKISALMALMCFHASRLGARISTDNAIQLYADQDKSKRTLPLIQKGEAYLNKSAKGNVISKYHLEAAIAFWHTTDKDEKWDNILQLYNRLLTIEYSPVIALNRTYALAKANSIDEAIKEAKKLDLGKSHFYHCLLAELYHMKGDIKNEERCLKNGLDLAKKQNEKELIQSKLDKLIS